MLYRPTVRLAILFVAAVAMLCGTRAMAAEAPLRVAVAAQPSLSSAQANDAWSLHVLKGYLIAEFASDAGVYLLDPQRVDTLCLQYATNVYDVDAAFMFEHVRTRQRVDVLIYLELAREGGVVVHVMRNGSTQSLIVARDATQGDWPRICSETADFVRKTLGLGRNAVNDRARTGPRGDAATFYRMQIARSLPPYLDPSAARLARIRDTDNAFGAYHNAMAEMLAPSWKEHPESTQLAAARLYYAAVDVPSPAESFSEEQAAAIQHFIDNAMGECDTSVLHQLLATPAGAPFEDQLQRICVPLMPDAATDAADDLLMETLEGADAEPAVIAVSRSATHSRASRLAALRALGTFDTKSAGATLKAAAASSDRDVRLAAALAAAEGRRQDDVPLLLKLAGDADRTIQIAAQIGLWRNGKRPAALLPVLRDLSDEALAALPYGHDAFAALADEHDTERLRSLSRSTRGPSRVATVTARLRLGAVASDERIALLKDDHEQIVLQALEHLATNKPTADERSAIRMLANDPIPAIAAAARDLLSASRREGDDAPLLTLDTGTQYERLRVLRNVSMQAGDDSSSRFLEHASTNFLPLVRLEALRLMDAIHPTAIEPALRTGVVDVNKWVRLQAASIASKRDHPALADALKLALERETSDAIRPALEIAYARATGTSPPKLPPAARQPDTDARWVWAGAPWHSDLDRAPIDAFLYYPLGPAQELRDHDRTLYTRALWGSAPAPEALLRDPMVLSKFWLDIEADFPKEAASLLDGFDFRLFGLGRDWPHAWRAFCLEAGIDPDQVDGDFDNLTPYEQRAFERWNRDNGITGYNLLRDLTQLKHAFIRPGVGVSAWGNLHNSITPVDVDARRWQFDVGWGMPGGRIGWTEYAHARMARTLWPKRPFVYLASIPGGLPDQWVRFNSPMPDDFIFESEHRVLAQTLIAWMAEANLNLAGYWRFIDYKTKAEGLYTPSVNIAFTALDPGSEALDTAIERALDGAPLDMPGAALDDTDDAGLITLDEKPDPSAGIRQSMTLGMHLMQKHLYDCARLYRSLPVLDRQLDTLLVLPGLETPSATVRSDVRPVIAARELAPQHDILPGINLAAHHRLDRYRLIIVHNVTLLDDDAIRAITQWLKTTPGLLIIHQDLTASNAAQTGTVSDHSGTLKEDWPWERAMAIHPPAAVAEQAGSSTFKLTTKGDTLSVTAEASFGYVTIDNGSVTGIATAEGKAVLAQRSDPAYRGVVIYDGLRSPSKAYVQLLADTINALAANGVGRAVSRHPCMLETTTEHFKVVASPGYGDAIKQTMQLTGIDVITGVVDPKVGPDSLSAAIVPLKPYINQHLACTPSIAALGEQPFAQARQVEGGLLLQNDGVIQVASQKPLLVTRENGTRLTTVPFSHRWVLEGDTEGVTTYTSRLGGRLTFVRCADPVRLTEPQ